MHIDINSFFEFVDSYLYLRIELHGFDYGADSPMSACPFFSLFQGEQLPDRRAFWDAFDLCI